MAIAFYEQPNGSTGRRILPLSTQSCRPAVVRLARAAADSDRGQCPRTSRTHLNQAVDEPPEKRALDRPLMALFRVAQSLL
jgi:hypothetical protein